jgi:hypothetical protein
VSEDKRGKEDKMKWKVRKGVGEQDRVGRQEGDERTGNEDREGRMVR